MENQYFERSYKNSVSTIRNFLDKIWIRNSRHLGRNMARRTLIWQFIKNHYRNLINKTDEKCSFEIYSTIYR